MIASTSASEGANETGLSVIASRTNVDLTKKAWKFQRVVQPLFRDMEMKMKMGSEQPLPW
jgi:hypothetical protein